MFSYSKKHKRLRHFFAYVLSLAMVLSNLSYMQVQASTVSGGDAQIMQVSEDGVASVSGNEARGASGEIPTNWTFSIAAGFTDTIQGTSATVQGLGIDASASGAKFAGRDSDVQVTNGTVVNVPVSGNSIISLVVHSSSYTAGMTFNDEEATINDATLTYEYTGSAGTVAIKVSQETYWKSMTVTAVEGSEDGNESTNKEYVLNVGDLTAGSVSETIAAGTDDYFSLTSGFTVESNTKTFTIGTESVEVTQRMKTGGDSNSTKKSILFTVGSGTTADIYVGSASSSGSADAQVVLCDMSGNVIALDLVERGVETTTVWEDIPAGSYYIGSLKNTTENTVTGNVNFYYVKVAETALPPAETDYVLNVGDLAAGSISETITAGTDDYFSLTNGFTVESNTKTFTIGTESVEVTQRMKTGGDSNSTKKSILFTVGSGTTADIYVGSASSSGSADAQVVLCDMSGNVIALDLVERGVETTTVWEDIPAGSYYIGSLKNTTENTVTGNVNFYYVKVVETVASTMPTVSTVSAVQSAENKASVTISFTGNPGAEDSAYIVEASNNGGTKWVKLDTVDGTKTEGSVVVDLASEDYGYGTWQFRVSGSNSVVASESIEYLADTYTLTGTYNTGLGEDVVNLTGITFTAVSDSFYEIPETVLDTTNYTYSVVLEKGTTYEMAVAGVDDYSLINPTEAFTYSADTTVDLKFEKKVFYPITISLGSTPNLTGKSLVYTFTHSDGSVYSFTDASAIQLRDGNYKVALGGDMAQMAYGINVGDTLTVSGAPVNHVITFRALTSWSFGADFTDKIEGTTGWYKGLSVDATSGKLAPHASSGTAQFNAGTKITVPVSGPCKIAVSAYQAKYATYTINGEAASTDTVTTEVEYTGAAGTIDIVSTGSAYIASITLTYPAKEVEYVEQSVMPFVPASDTDGNTEADTDNIPRRNNEDSITVQPVGQKLNLSQTGGSFADKFADTDNVAYYLFPMTDKHNKLEFDLVVTESKSTGNAAGFFGGVFTDNYVYSLGLRAGGQKIRGIYSKNGGLEGGSFAGAGSPNEEVVGLNRPIHYTIEWDTTAKRHKVSINFLDDAGVLQERSWSQNPIPEPDGSTPTKFYYGVALADVSVVITNMLYTGEDGSVLYDQNACYYPNGSAPTATSVSAVAAEARTHIDVTWTGSVAEDDGTYVVEMQKDGGEWVELNDDVTGFSYRYEIPAGDGGEYLFRVCGQLGKETLGGDRTAYATMAEAIYVVGALETPVIEITEIERVDGETGTLTLNWQQIASAEYYQLYRYSDDQGEAEAECIAERLTTNSYVDTVEIDMPYYYYVKAVSEAADNESPWSETVWSMVPSSRTAHRVQYGAETEDIFLTKKSYDTVFTDKATVEGIVYADGTLEVWVNDVVVEEKQVTEGVSFAYELTLEEGRNDVELRLVKDAETTRRALNFVYLTKYDIVVDGAYDGTDGAANANGIPTYKTVQAAVNSVPSNNADSKVILVMAGSYEERLEVNTPFISLIGEDRENTLIHFYPGVLGTNYEAGGDMDKRCATYIKSGAKNFSAENISFANDYVYGTNDGKSNKSADAIRVEAENSTFVNVHFIGVQDTLYMHSGYQYYEKCLIEGLVDFIYSGEAARSVFKDCELRFVYESTKTSGYVSAPKTAADAEYGLVFVDCSVTAEEGCAGNGYLLARPWGADAYIAWINTYMGKAVNELAPYNDMSGNMHEDARFFEFGTYGPGFAINADRRQMSFTKSENFVKKSWDGINNMNDLSSEHYIGDIVTDAEEKFEETEPNDDKYLWSEGDDTGLGMYAQEGYASYYEVTGGGLLKENNDNYYLVSTAEDFLDALVAIKASGKPSVIELIADIKLGCNEIANFAEYNGIIKEYNAQPLTHPTLIESGVSQVTLDKINNLTIFSQYGSSIMHANITMKNSENIIIRNIKFDELWEWDETTGGDYDRNDWDYMTVDSTCDGIWVDHCTFYKAYDGIIDVKNPAPTVNVTISWCEFLPGSEYNVFFNTMMDEIFENPAKYPTYQHMLEEGMTNEQIYMYAYGQKKTHLFGQSDDAVSAAGIRATLANNYYKDTMDRLPRLRYGYSHVYNCIMDAQNLLDVRLSISNEDIAKKIVSNGASSTCGAKVLLENCYISGIQNAMNSGNGSSPSGYINAINSLYYMDGVATELAPKVNTSKEGEPLLITDADTFIADLPYEEYKLYDAEELHGIVIPYAGAGKLRLTVLQWEKTSYNVTEEEEVEEPEVEEAPINKAETGEKNSLPESVVNALREVTGCGTAEELVDYLRTEITTNEAVTGNLSGINVADTVVVDIRVLVSYDGFHWDLATPANFPAEGVDVLIPYENIGSGTVELNKEGFDYVVGHMITSGNRIGQMEFFSGDDLIKTDEGIQIHIMSASPFVIGWKAVGSAEPTPGPTVAPGVEPTPGPTAEPQQTAAPGATQKPDFTPVLPSQITSPKTGDDSVWVYEELLPEKLPEKSDTINVPVMVGVDAVNNAASGESALWLMVLVIMGVFGIGLGIMSKRYLKKEEE